MGIIAHRACIVVHSLATADSGRTTRMSRCPVLVFLAVGLGCGAESVELPPAVVPETPRPPAAPGPVAGGRLRPQLVTSTDGIVTRFLQWIDLVSGEPCMLDRVVAPGDAVRCRPRGYGYVVYLDDRCTRPYVDTGDGDRKWISTDRG